MRLVRSRRRLAGLVAAAAIATVAWSSDPWQVFVEDDAAAEPVLRDTGTVQVRTLTEDYTAEGTLAFAHATTAYVVAPPGEETVTSGGRGVPAQTTVTPAPMTVTELVAEGTIVETGDVLWRLGAEPTVVLDGAVPAWRELGEGDEGADVAQLEAALVALGYDPDGTVTVDDEFTAATEAMVERWQEAMGAEVDGVVARGAVVFVSGPTLVGDSDLSVGSTAIDGQIAFELRRLDAEVSFDVAAADRGSLGVGDTVSVVAGNERFDSTVRSMTVTEDGGATVVAVPTTAVAPASDEVPADVDWSVVLASDVVTVPAEAIVRTDDRRTWVEVRDDVGRESWVEVEVAVVSNGRAEVSGDLAVDDLVIAP